MCIALDANTPSTEFPFRFYFLFVSLMDWLFGSHIKPPAFSFLKNYAFLGSSNETKLGATQPFNDASALLLADSQRSSRRGAEGRHTLSIWLVSNNMHYISCASPGRTTDKTKKLTLDNGDYCFQRVKKPDL